MTLRLLKQGQCHRKLLNYMTLILWPWTCDCNV